MIKDILNGHLFNTVNPFVKSFIISESFFWTSWSLFTPIFAIFATNKISGGNIEVAASTFSVYFVARIISELLTSKLSSKLGIREKISLVILGISLVSISYVGFAFTTTVFPLYIFWIICGWGFGIATPPKLSLFSTHLDRHKETVEWGATDSINLALMALSTMAGGFIANQYGFKPLFLLASVINILAIIPFITYKTSQ
ncbi:MFS transporter [Candidatus Daviesbacteria bacterium]|nr:MFS transporter [Candidatus Daviesbacteria bacterium]